VRDYILTNSGFGISTFFKNPQQELISSLVVNSKRKTGRDFVFLKDSVVAVFLIYLWKNFKL
jgi:hypothetical protein